MIDTTHKGYPIAVRSASSFGYVAIISDPVSGEIVHIIPSPDEQGAKGAAVRFVEELVKMPQVAAPWVAHIVNSGSSGPSSHAKIILEQTTAGQTFEMRVNFSTGALEVNNSGSNPFKIQPGSPTNSVVVTTTGVGIGTAAPNAAAALDVNGAIYQRGALLHADDVWDEEIEPLKVRGAKARRDRHLPHIGPRRAMPVLDEHGDPVLSDGGVPQEQEFTEIGTHLRGVTAELEIMTRYALDMIARIEDLEAKVEKLERRGGATGGGRP